MDVLVEKTMQANKRNIPLIAALPFRIHTRESPTPGDFEYNPVSQRSTCGRNYSTCRVDESVGFFNSKSDTQKDD